MLKKSLHLANLIIDDGKLKKPSPGKFAVNEIFLSIQGEGLNTGKNMIFVRFSECNMRCTVKNSGFDCDTEFVSNYELDEDGLLKEIEKFSKKSEWVLFTGGEPALQLTESLVSKVHRSGFKVAIETNGTIKLPDGIDWIAVSPKSAEHTLRQKKANEVKYVRAYGMALPDPSIEADNFLISPPFQADGRLLKEDLDWCLKLISEDPKWRLSVQTHKLLGLR